MNILYSKMSGTSKVLHPGALGVGSLGRLTRERKNARRVGRVGTMEPWETSIFLMIKRDKIW